MRRLGAFKTLGILMMVLAASMIVSVAWADPIGPECTDFGNTEDSCFGNVFTLEYGTITTNLDGNWELEVTLTIDTTDTTLDATDVIRDIAIKITSNTDDVIGATLTATTAGTTGDWTVLVGGLNNNGCSDGSEGFICAQDGDVAPLDGSTYTWTFSVEVEADSLLTAAGGASVKARYCVEGTDCEQNDFQGLTSEPITGQGGSGGEGGFGGAGGFGGEGGFGGAGGLVPGPGTLVFLGAGLLGLAVNQGIRRIRRR